MLENSINNNADSTLLLAKSIQKDIEAAKTHLSNHDTIEEVLTLDMNCEYYQYLFWTFKLYRCLLS
jgi:hypothetical protein